MMPAVHRSFIVLLAATLGFLLFQCVQKEQDESELPCVPGISEPCYTGPEGTDGVGICRMGQSFCWEEGGVVMGPVCRNQTVPQMETCNGLDDDCDGREDNNGACTDDMVERLEKEVGNVEAVYRPELVGPYLLVNGKWATLYECPGGRRGEACADIFVRKELLEGFGLALHGDQTTEHANRVKKIRVSEAGGVQYVTYRQLHVISEADGETDEVPVEDGWLSIGVKGDRIFRLSATIVPVPDNLSHQAMLNLESLGQVADDLVGENVVVEKVVFTKRDDGGRLPPVEIQEPVLAYRVDTPLRRYYLDAGKPATEKAILYQVPRAAGLGGTFKISSGGDLNREKADDVLRMFVDYVEENTAITFPEAMDLSSLDIRTPDNPPAEGICPITQSGRVCPNVENSAEKGVIHACQIENRLEFCEPRFSVDALIHEASHFLNERGAPGGMKSDHLGEITIDEALAFVQSRLFQCYESHLGGHYSGVEEENIAFSCDWLHPEVGLRVDREEDWANVEFRRPVSPVDEQDRIFTNAALIARSFHIILESFQERLLADYYMGRATSYHPSEIPLIANRKVRDLIHRMVVEDLHPVEGRDVWTAAFAACEGLQTGNPFRYTQADCTAVLSAFRETGILEDQGFSGLTELCNGLDDDGDGLRDNCTESGQLCTEMDRLNEGTLKREYYTGDPEKRGKGRCRAGRQVCVDGQWEWESGYPPFTGEEEVCNYLDDDCDGLTDEVGTAAGALQVKYILDQDRDCYGSGDRSEIVSVCLYDDGSGTTAVLDSEKIPSESVFSQYDLPIGSCNRKEENSDHYFVAYTDTPPEYLDCDDGNPDVFPDAEEICNGIDDDCSDAIDDDERFSRLGAVCSAGEDFCKAYGNYVCTEDGLGVECNAIAGEGIKMYEDKDGDGYTGHGSRTACSLEPGWLLSRSAEDDCCDCSARMNPGLTEICDGINNDCAGGIDDGEGVCEAFPIQLESILVDHLAQTASSGDIEFDGNGPYVKITIKIEIVDESRIITTVSVYMKETASNWTEGIKEVIAEYPDTFERPAIICGDTRVRSVNIDFDYIDSGHGEDYPVPEEIASEMVVRETGEKCGLTVGDIIGLDSTCIGDTYGGDIGTEEENPAEYPNVSGCIINFGEIFIEERPEIKGCHELCE